MLTMLAGGNAPFYMTPDFWVAVSFLGFVALLLFYKVPALVGRMLDDRAEAIRKEIDEIESGKADKADNVLKMAPHTNEEVCGDTWNHSYGREKAAFPVNVNREWKYWPTASRVDSAYGDRNLVCTCPPIEAYAEAVA